MTTRFFMLNAALWPALFLVVALEMGSWMRPASAQTATQACVATPQQTQGPYYLPLELLRKDITEGQPGVPLTLRLEVVDASTCSPLPGLTVDLWHASAEGVYSGIADNGMAGQAFLRGSQVTDSQGAVEFQTIYPGWYPGRTAHIHYKVHLPNGTEFTSQLYFDDSVSDRIYQQAPYSSHTGTRVRNDQDSVLRMTPGGSSSVIAQTAITDRAVNANLRVGVVP